ncbi:uncharacterized protein (TIGR02301 family) [Rhodoblastus acidophilus]|uniref:TIGR02301 family protein n=1 Tax=Rhodoblastus acidophilus TaxID=1074 RepID=UPI001622EDB3|nr:TIGR02301 family protein [Rhodoblastus acidophilus]MCW2285629.1 uncharacterized protein (TIGR02301 family) [Rhodoblastus acidophilus]MCW2334613.1 uncharacterized protein (TIGR02301 family) [Rhodoblastus acidophilus]
MRARIALPVLLAALLTSEPAPAQFFQFFNPQPARPPVAAPPPREAKPKPKKPRAKQEQRRPVAKAEPKKPDAPKVEGPPPPFEPQLLRLSEIMGALAVLDPLCGDSGKAGWRDNMQKLMDAQESGPMQRERLAGAYNRGLRGYTYFHRRCTDGAELARVRLMDEGGRLAHEIATTYRER